MSLKVKKYRRSHRNKAVPRFYFEKTYNLRYINLTVIKLFVISYKLICRGGGIGIRGRLRACAHYGREGSSPSLGTGSCNM